MRLNPYRVFLKKKKTIPGIGLKRIWYYESDDFTTLYFA